MERGNKLIGFVAAAAVLVPACSLIVGSDVVQCSSLEDCTGRGGAFAATTCVAGRCQFGDGGADPFACIGNVPAEPLVDKGKLNNLQVQLRNTVTAAALPNITLRLCTKLDLPCTSPVAPDQITDSDGRGSFKAAAGERLYVIATPPSGAMLLPALIYLDPAVDKDRFVEATLLEESAFNFFFGTLGIARNPQSGAIFVPVTDCSFDFKAKIPGIRIETNAMAVDLAQFYLENNLPSRQATETDDSSLGGFVNVPPGVRTVTTFRAANGQRIGSNTVFVRQGYVTFAPVAPQ